LDKLVQPNFTPLTRIIKIKVFVLSVFGVRLIHKKNVKNVKRKLIYIIDIFKAIVNTKS